MFWSNHQLLAQVPDFGRRLPIQFFQIRVQLACQVEVRRLLWTLSMMMTAQSSLTVDVERLAIFVCHREFRLRTKRW